MANRVSRTTYIGLSRNSGIVGRYLFMHQAEVIPAELRAISGGQGNKVVGYAAFMENGEPVFYVGEEEPVVELPAVELPAVELPAAVGAGGDGVLS